MEVLIREQNAEVLRTPAFADHFIQFRGTNSWIVGARTSIEPTLRPFLNVENSFEAHFVDGPWWNRGGAELRP